MGRGRTPGGLSATFALALALASAEGCSVRHSAPARSGVPSGDVAGDLTSSHDRARLDALAAARAGLPANDGYRIGPDDLLDIRIPDLLDATAVAARPTQGAGPDLQPVSAAPVFQQGLRVGASGTITVPMLGVVAVAGVTPAELEQDLAQRLVDAGILRAPQVTVLVAEHRSHVVAVIGSVERPGLYPLTRPGATLADLVWAAGGPTREAGRVVEFVPAEDATGEKRAPIRVDVEALLHPSPGDGFGASLRAWAGDVINVAPAGSVLVDGWVDKPGSYPITRGLTVRGALAAAGGHVFAADRRSVSVKRVLPAGEDRSFTVDLDAIAKGMAPDVPVTDGDVIRLRASYPRLVPYSVWAVAKEMVHIGGSVPLF